MAQAVLVQARFSLAAAAPVCCCFRLLLLLFAADVALHHPAILQSLWGNSTVQRSLPHRWLLHHRTQHCSDVAARCACCCFLHTVLFTRLCCCPCYAAVRCSTEAGVVRLSEAERCACTQPIKKPPVPSTPPPPPPPLPFFPPLLRGAMQAAARQPWLRSWPG